MDAATLISMTYMPEFKTKIDGMFDQISHGTNMINWEQLWAYFNEHRDAIKSAHLVTVDVANVGNSLEDWEKYINSS